MLIAGYDTPLGLLKSEVAQLEEEGFIVDKELKNELNALDDVKNGYDESLSKYYLRLENLAVRPDFCYVEPDDLAAIRAERPEMVTLPELNLKDEALLMDKLHGAFTGRFAGCALGQVVEGWEMGRIREYLEKTGNYPLKDYISYQAAVPEADFAPKTAASWKENIKFMGPDDDVNYTLMALYVLEKYGKNFQWFEVALSWNDCLVYNQICTAETQAILNFNMMRKRYEPLVNMKATCEFTRRYNNPYREWIGAQIRADGWAYCAAGNIELAAEYAYRDACWTHTKNGIYGEMFMAAAIAASFVTSNPDSIVAAGLSQIPARSRLAEAIKLAQQWVTQCADFVEFMYKLDAHFPKMNWVHTINNAMICVMAIYYGKMDPDKSIAIAVMAGKDTDCNGATVGSIVGAARGRKEFGGILAGQLHDTVKPLMLNFQETSMIVLAKRAYKIIAE